jgi:hypothetical protein
MSKVTKHDVKLLVLGIESELALCKLLTEFKAALKISTPIDPHEENPRRYGSRLMQRLEKK